MADISTPLLFEDRFPQEGATVHGRLTDSGELRIPGLLISGKVQLENASTCAPQRPMELKVIQVEEIPIEKRFPMRRCVNRIVLQFIRYLSTEDLA